MCLTGRSVPWVYGVEELNVLLGIELALRHPRSLRSRAPAEGLLLAGDEYLKCRCIRCCAPQSLAHKFAQSSRSTSLRCFRKMLSARKDRVRGCISIVVQSSEAISSKPFHARVDISYFYNACFRSLKSHSLFVFPSFPVPKPRRIVDFRPLTGRSAKNFYFNKTKKHYIWCNRTRFGFDYRVFRALLQYVSNPWGYRHQLLNEPS